ncbi:MAG: 4Fe-4S dicluster domain-containing protein [Thermodesulfobacteriota bacterium]|nr:4Fe-4S dicluster domain-containing protein [Thermodesulfobacteriota bacterium]
MEPKDLSTVVPVASFSKEVERDCGVNVDLCFQCKKCSSGCPVNFAMDFPPDLLMHMIHMGMKEKVLKSSTIWVCAACETCVTRCPNEIDIPRVMDTLGQMAERSGIVEEKKAPVFNEAFLSSIKKRGRVFELGMIQKYTLKSGDLQERLISGEFFNEAKLGWEMFKRGKLRVFPQKIKGKGEVKSLFKKADMGG